MQIEFVLVADAAGHSAAGLIDALGIGGDRISAAVFPAQCPILTVVAKAVIEPDELDQKHYLEARVVGTDGQVLSAPAVAPIIIGAHVDRSLPVVHMQIFRLVNLIFPLPGRYEIRVFSDGDEAAAIPLNLVLETA